MRRCLLVFEPPEGGVAEHVLRLALGLPAHGWDPTVIGPPASMVYPALREAGVPVVPLSLRAGFGSPRADLLAARSLSAIVRRGRFDLVHLHSAKAGVLGRVLPRRARKVVYSPHLFGFEGPPGPRRPISRALERALAPRTDAIVCVAESERQAALKNRIAPATKLRVVPSGADCPSGLPADTELEAFASGRPLVACLTVLRRQKTVHVFLEAAALVLQRLPTARLAVVGDGPLKPDLEKRARELGIAEEVRFFAFSPPSARQLASLDVYVLPSAWEAFPIGILEAMACGVPQVVTDVGGSSEAVVHGETGLLCPPNQPRALAEAIVTLVEDDHLRVRMSSASRARHRRLFGLEPMVARMAALYAEISGLAAVDPPPADGSGAEARAGQVR